MYVYVQSERPEEGGSGLWTVGFYDPKGKWVSESDWGTASAAAARVRWLNGGSKPEPEPTCNDYPEGP